MGHLIKAFAALTETNARVAAAVQISGNTLIGVTISVVSGTIALNVGIVPTLGALVTGTLLSGIQFVFYRYFAPLILIFHIISPYLSVIFDKRTYLQKVEPQFEPSFSKRRLDTLTNQLQNNDEVQNLDNILILSSSHKTL